MLGLHPVPPYRTLRPEPHPTLPTAPGEDQLGLLRCLARIAITRGRRACFVTVLQTWASSCAFPGREADRTHTRLHVDMPALATLPIAVLADRAGVDIATIQVYGHLGLISKPRRMPSGSVLYPAEEAKRVTIIKRFLDLGFDPKDIKTMLGVGGGKLSQCADVYKIVERHLSDIRQRLVELRRIEQQLAPLVAACPRKGSLADCPVVNALSHPPVRRPLD
jgi:DNA-binding transcriptional MerR regulator